MAQPRGVLIDTHCHPQYFPDGPDAVLERARSVGVGTFVPPKTF